MAVFGEQPIGDKELVHKLTPSARSVMNDLVAEYASVLLNQASDIACKHDTQVEISYKDILDAHKIIMRRRNDEKTIEKPNKRMRFLTFVFLSACVYIAMGLALYFLSVIRSYNDPFIEKMGLIICVLGVGFLFLAMIFRSYFDPNDSYVSGRYTQKEEEYNSSRIVDLWSNIETLGRELIENDNTSGGSDEKSVTTIINYLSSVLDEPGDKEKLKEVLKVRNSIIQESGDIFSRAKIQEIIAIEIVIIERLKQMRKK